MSMVQGAHKQSRTGLLIPYEVSYQLNGSPVEWRGQVVLPDGVARPLQGGTVMEVAAATAQHAVETHVWHEIDQTDWLAGSPMGPAE